MITGMRHNTTFRRTPHLYVGFAGIVIVGKLGGWAVALSPCNVKVNDKGLELMQHGTALFPIGCYHDDLTYESVPWHWHDELELLIVTEGAAVCATDREQAVLQTGEGCFFNADVLHAVWKEGNGVCRLHSMSFHPRLVGGAVESVFWQKYILPLVENKQLQMRRFSAEDGEILREIETAWRSCVDEPVGYELLTRNALSAVILHLMAYLPKGTASLSKRALLREERIKLMLDYIRSHLGDAITVAQIASAASVSESECVRCFRSAIHTPPIQYVKQYRLQKAMELLKETDKRINEIGEECGFQEMSYFAKAFRELYGLTPTEFRKKSARQKGGE